MTQLLLIDCKTMLVARYDGRKRDDRIARIDISDSPEIGPQVLRELEQFRVHGYRALLPVVK